MHLKGGTAPQAALMSAQTSIRTARESSVDIYVTIFELIDMRSFTSMWFWIVLAVFWSMMSHYVLGVPYDLIQRAARIGGEPMQDVEMLVRLNTKRILFFGSTAGLIVTGFGAFALSSLALLGFAYGVEFCQAMFFLGFPFAVVSILGQRSARLIHSDGTHGTALLARLRKHRFATQAVGIVSIFVTAFWGIFHAMSTSILG